MKKQIKLLIENIFNDIYDIDNENNVTIEINDNIHINDIINKYSKLEGNRTEIKSFSADDLLKLEQYFEFAHKLYIFIINTEHNKNIYYKIQQNENNEVCIYLNYDESYKEYNNLLTVYMENYNIIKKLEYKGSHLLTVYDNEYKFNFINLLSFLEKQNIILKEINYIINGYIGNKIKKITFGKYVWGQDSSNYILTNFILNHFPDVYISRNKDEKLNIFNINGVKACIDGIYFESEDICKKFYEYLKQHNIKKYDCDSYGYILNSNSKGYNKNDIDKIQTEFCIANKFDQYSLATDKEKINNLVKKEVVSYCKEHYDLIHDHYMWKISYEEKGKDSDGSFIQIKAEINFTDKNGKFKRIILLYNFYKTGFLKFNKDLSTESIFYYK